MSQDNEPRTPAAADLHVGRRMRVRRREVGMSQEALAEALGITFQQVQKYERGANRVSASKLLEAARALGVAPAYFFEGLDWEAAPGSPAGGPPDALGQLALVDGGPELASAFATIRNGEDRRRVLDLAQRLAQVGKPVAAAPSTALEEFTPGFGPSKAAA